VRIFPAAVGTRLPATTTSTGESALLAALHRPTSWDRRLAGWHPRNGITPFSIRSTKAVLAGRGPARDRRTRLGG
jgi:hypothetical protein